MALVAVTEENGHPVIVGGGRYVALQPGKAEVAFSLVDQYQGEDAGAALTLASLRLPVKPGSKG